LSPPRKIDSVHRNEQGQPYVTVTCRSCAAEWAKRHDSLKNWGGLCRRCATTQVAARPEIREMLVANGKAVMARVGKLPHYPDRNYRRGAASPSWRGGITPENQRIRLSKEMQEWRSRVFERDNYTCQLCKRRGVVLHADHIKPFAVFPELRFDLDNGRTLCVPCHYTYGARAHRGKVVREAVLSLVGS
jgi:5-methylcytosine-specific restriction endonuclease McrA